MRRSSLRRDSAFTLIEVTVALGMFIFCIASVFVLLPTGVSSGQHVLDEMVALNLGASLIADLQATPKGSKNSPLYGVSTDSPGAIQFASESLAVTAPAAGAVQAPPDARYRITTKAIPASGPTMFSRVIIRITWPAILLPDQAHGSVTVFGAFNFE